MMTESLAAIIGGSAGGLVMVVLVIGIIWFCILQCKKLSNKSSETGSSDPSALAEWNRVGGSTTVGGPALSGAQGGRQFSLLELEQATKQFGESNHIGSGSFGLVYKGILRDGTVVAVKRRSSVPRHEFVEEVAYLSEIRHRNLVTLLGYCQEEGYQILVFEYLPNNNVCGHLYDNGEGSTTQLEFKQRLSIALGAAKGLCHLHCLASPIVHKNFKTANVLVDENFIAKVADAGIFRLLEITDDAGPSSLYTNQAVFRDPEARESGTISQRSDVYSFGVFLLELVSGHEASRISFSESGDSLTKWVESRLSSNILVDSRLTSNFTSDGMKDLIKLTLGCIDSTGRGRPRMDMVVSELDRILEKEMTQTNVMGVGTATVTLGSQLFTSG